MARKPIPEETQKQVLTNSRRRCCLCFWLNGMDEVQKGQIAHLDGNNEHADEANLAFLCFDHHDEYDGVTRLAKGLKENEVKHWRDELYREMAYRFRTVKTHDFALSIVRFILIGPHRFKARFRLKNIGETTAHLPAVSLRLPDGVAGELPKETFWDGRREVSLPTLDPGAPCESRQDYFEQNGRVVVTEVAGRNLLLAPGEAWEFEAMVFDMAQYPPGSSVELEYRVDAKDLTPVLGTLSASVPSDPKLMLPRQ